MIKVGVLELQGDFALHHQLLNNLDVDSMPVKCSNDLQNLDGLIIPGGESTTISLLINSFDMHNSLIDFGKSQPVLGTCAGLIIMASNINDKRITPLGLIDIVVERNAYGRQIESKKEIIQFNLPNNYVESLPTTFIRAPKIKEIGSDMHVIGEYMGSPIAVLSGHHLCLTFHPELDGIDIFHRILFDPDSQFYYNINN